MNKPVQIRQVAFIMLQSQLTWTLWYIGILVIINIARLIFRADGIDTFYNHAFVASNVYMLVIGIVVISFMPYFVEIGVTRKNYFYGNTIASLCLSILIPVFAYVLTIFEKLILGNFKEPNFNIKSAADGNFIGDLLQSILITPYVDVETNILLSLAVFSLNIFAFYLIGWLIGAAFYRLGVIGGILVIAIGIVLITAKDSMQRIAMDLPLFETYAFFDAVPSNIAYILLVVVMLIPLILIRTLTKRAPIKI
ncbi:hypothetical protein [Oceanobacillus alkalisoli]|uniref:hypothetical protein n=1 Tax=Oceanobacillus alkalisoli TaxID=2925113 RepID=UPI001EE3BC49|nr:hypothetical protein [Oceanobacillus alkalisoli]MCG5104942.1 hypothetical protein [Oceanobacillus alkalisoli]